MNIIENKSEELFKELCNQQYLKGFVFHSPKYNDPTEKEAGDVVLWIRNLLIVFEIVWRNPSSNTPTKSFIQRIGEKRKQLEGDFETYKNKQVLLINEEGTTVEYGRDNFLDGNFSGVIIVDSDVELENIHNTSYQKTLENNFPIAIMTKNDFEDLLIEIDTISDLLYYLRDRYNFLKNIYSHCPKKFINLNLRMERNLIALYKRKSNSFDKYTCDDLNKIDIWDRYRENFKNKIDTRDKENKTTTIIDDIIDNLLKQPLKDETMPLHAWELGLLSRRERVILANKINHALLSDREESRQFAYFNPSTECWLVFYFQYNSEYESLLDNLQNITNLKLIKEIEEESFHYSVFGYGFHILSNELGVVIEDAEYNLKYSKLRYKESLKYFGKPKKNKINEFIEEF
jgi:hypothetical protein